MTCTALYVAFKDIDWSELFSHIQQASKAWLGIAVGCTIVSYFMRARRWQLLFPSIIMDFWKSYQVLVLGFFMNNVLPARAGEFVRAHMGAKVGKESRTLVLATIASERLADGVTLSLFFVVFALGMGDQHTSQSLLYVAYLFLFATASVALVLLNRAAIFIIADKIHARVDSKASKYAAERIQIFLNGLAPLYSRHKLPLLVIWSIIIWCIELFVYVSIGRAYSASLSLQSCVLFMVTVNFSSLIPAAPGGIGVIEAVTSAVLVSIGVPKEQALSMVMTQHFIQYAVIGAPGLLFMLNWKKTINAVVTDESLDGSGKQAEPSAGLDR